MSDGRRLFLYALGASAVGLAGGARGSAAVAGDKGSGAATGKGRYGIAYTSFAVRLQRGRDLIRGAGAPALAAEPFLDLCRSFGADGCQMDLSQLASTEAAYLDGLKRRLDEARLFLELSVDAGTLEDEARFAEVAAAGEDGLAFYGTNGMLTLSRAGFEIVPERAISPEDQIPRFSGPRPVSAPPFPRTTPLKEDGYDQVRDQFEPHVRNFVDCVKSRKTPVSDLASSHRSSVPPTSGN